MTAPEQALASLERQWQQQTSITRYYGNIELDDDVITGYMLDSVAPLTPAQLAERGFPEPEI